MSNNAVTAAALTTAGVNIQALVTAMNADPDVKITQPYLTLMSSKGVSKFVVKGKCTDAVGQEQYVTKTVTLSNGETDITMVNQPANIAYDRRYSQDVKFIYDYKNCASSTVTITYTSTLQKLVGANTWADTSLAAEKITNGNTIPSGLDQTAKYRQKVIATNGSTKTLTTYIDLLFSGIKPDMTTNNIKPYFKADTEFSYTFTEKDFVNVATFSNLKMSMA